MAQTIPHTTPQACIDALRSALARYEIQDSPRRGPRSEHFAGGEIKTTVKYHSLTVLLDGDEIPLPDAAARLGVGATALYHRIYRNGRAGCGTPDIRKLGADKRRNRWS